jgi:hypothetical protein
VCANCWGVHCGLFWLTSRQASFAILDRGSRSWGWKPTHCFCFWSSLGSILSSSRFRLQGFLWLKIKKHLCCVKICCQLHISFLKRRTKSLRLQISRNHLVCKQPMICNRVNTRACFMSTLFGKTNCRNVSIWSRPPFCTMNGRSSSCLGWSCSVRPCWNTFWTGLASMLGIRHYWNQSTRFSTSKMFWD